MDAKCISDVAQGVLGLPGVPLAGILHREHDCISTLAFPYSQSEIAWRNSSKLLSSPTWSTCFLYAFEISNRLCISFA